MKDRGVLVLGSSGMAGHALAAYIRESGGFDVSDVGPRSRAFESTILADILTNEGLERRIDEIAPGCVVNCVGMLVKACEERKREAIYINAYLPRLLSEICASRAIRLIHLSTDCVFSGANGPYDEDATRDGDSFYDRTKALGEIVDGGDLTIRTSIIGPELREDGTGLFDWFVRQEGETYGFRSALWSGVTTIELAKFIHHVILRKPDLAGLVHYSVSGGISKFDLLGLIREEFGTKSRVVPVDEPRIDKRLICTRTDLGMAPVPYSLQIAEMRDWIRSHSDLYPRFRELA